ncbi:MAG: VWA domain-containing protein, partial [Acidimicrobiales bacterium]
LGFWTVASDGLPERSVAVNAAARESDLTPAPSLLTEERTSRPGDSPPRGEVSVLPWVVLPLLAVLAAEWWLGRRRSGVSRRQFRVGTALRLLVALALLGAMLDLAWVRPANRVATMFVIDASDSLGGGGQDDAVTWVRDAIDGMPSDARAGVALFGGDARLELTMQSDPRLSQPAVQIDPSRTDLAGALRLAAAVLPSDARRRVVLVSDGRPTQGDVLAEADRLAEAGIPVEVHTVARAGGPDSAVASLDGPGRVSQGESMTLRATVHADRAGPAVVSLLRDGETVEERTVDLAAGDNDVAFDVRAADPGLARFQVRVRTATDSVRENDVGYAAVQIEGPPAVLLLEGHDGAGDTLAAALRSAAVDVTVAAATALPPVDEMTTYSSIVLADVDARSLTGDQVTALSNAVRDLGRGLVTVGGTQSYGLGGYYGSELEKLLPVISDILDPKRRQTVSEVLAIDTSGSMGACHCAEGSNGMPGGGNRIGGGINKTDIARAGAARAIEALSERDEVGVLAVDTSERWVLDLQQLPAEEVVTSGLRELQPTGQGTDLSESLSTAAAALRDSKRSLKHIILFTDGFTDPSALEGLAEEAAALYDEGITISVLATGEGSATELEGIATAGGGRFYPGRNLQEIPQIMQQEATIASRDFVNEGEFVPTITSSAAPVRQLDATPPLLGYVATTSKPQATTHLRIGPDQDPLLASWNVGLGRVSSWTSDGGERWAQTWASWEGYVDFWAGVVKDTFPRSGASGGVTARVEDGALQVSVVADDPFPEGSEATARITGPDGQAYDVRLERTAGNTFAGEVPVTDAGSYAVAATVSQESSDDPVAGGTALASLSYSAEYEPGEADAALLARVSQRTAGRGEIDPGQAFDRDGLEAGRSRIPLTGWLLLAAALLWPLAVAVSRLALRGSVATQARYAGATALWWLRRARSRLPALPGRNRAAGPAPDAERERPARPERSAPTGSGGASPKGNPQPAATLGSLLESQRRRRSGADDPTDVPSGDGTPSR